MARRKRPSVAERIERDELFRKTAGGKGKKRYPSDRRTPAVACRVRRDEYEELQAIAEKVGDPLAHVIQAAIRDFLARYRAGEITLDKVMVRESQTVEKKVTKVVRNPSGS